ncbi:MAG: late competence development ComFB family protein [bacterium]|nr:late competence development ComFB family protein [bacterium]
MQLFDLQDREVVRNINEDFVFAEVERLLLESSEMCTCRDCRQDVAAIVLNSLPPRYQVSKIIPEAAKAAINGNVIENEIEKAFKLVSKRPHHL